MNKGILYKQNIFYILRINYRTNNLVCYKFYNNFKYSMIKFNLIEEITHDRYPKINIYDKYEIKISDIYINPFNKNFNIPYNSSDIYQNCSTLTYNYSSSDELDKEDKSVIIKVKHVDYFSEYYLFNSQYKLIPDDNFYTVIEEKKR